MTSGLTRTILLACFLVALSTRAFALVHYDFEQPIFTDPPEPVLDHCVVEEDGVYHLFYLRGNPAVNIGHATTTDFVHWTLQPPVLSPGTWDNRALWAPQLYPSPSGTGWLMYYTGVNTVGSQQIGLAFSNDLYSWIKWPNPIYHPDPSWAEWSETAFTHGRDPHIIQDNGHYYLLVTAKTNTNRGAVGCAVSDNLVEWQDIGPMFVNDTWHVMESVFVFRHNGKFQMMFTEETVNGTSVMSSDSLLSGWDIATRRIIDSGHAPQVTNTEFGELFSRHAIYNDNHGTQQYVIRFTPLAWLGDIPAVPKPLALAGAWTFDAGDAFYYQPVWGNNAAVRNDNYAKTWKGDSWINTYEYYTGPLGYGIPGSAQGETRTGSIRSATFTVTGNSMSLLVGGTDLPGQCCVSLYDASADTVLFSETGHNSNEMDLRMWDLRAVHGRDVYIRIVDNSTVGHICVDEIQESYDLLSRGGGNDGNGNGGGKGRPNDSTPDGVRPTDSPEAPRLLGNMPNPFNPVTTIRYELPRSSRVRLDVFDATGALVRTLVDAVRPAGALQERWSGVDQRGHAVSSGVYFSRLSVDGVLIDTRKMVLLK